MRYTVEIDGQIYEIEGPENATDEELFEAANQLYPQSTTGQTPSEETSSLAKLNRLVSSFLSGAAPYGAVASTGALAGAPFAGVGAPIGAGGATLALGASDLATYLYNTAAGAFGAPTVPLPSEKIRQTLQETGLAYTPQTGPERIAQMVGEFSAPGGMTGPAARTVASTFPATENVGTGVRTLVEGLGRAAPSPRVETVASGAAGLGVGAGMEAGVENPLALAALGLGSGMIGGRVVGPRAPAPVTTQQLADQATAAYSAARDAGVRFTKESVADLAQQIRTSISSTDNIQFNKNLHPRINTALEEFDAIIARDEPISFSEMDMLRRVTNTARRVADPDQNRLGALIIDKIDDFVQKPPANAIAAGNIDIAGPAIQNARQIYRRKAQGQELEYLVDRARNRAGADGDLTAAGLRAEFRRVVNNPRQLRKFDPQIQNLMKEFARGKGGMATLQAIGALAPGFSPRNLLSTGGLTAAGATGAVDPAVALMLAATGVGSRAAANRLASSRADELIRTARGSPQRERTRQSSVPIPGILSTIQSAPSPQEEAVQTYLGLLGQTGTPSGPYRN
jgi:hypothetical protein